MLACFSNQYERDQITKSCDNCWVGYTWKEGMSNDIFWQHVFLENDLFIEKLVNENIIINQFKYTCTSESWMSIPAIGGITCPNNVVPGLDSQSKVGKCARTKQDSSNKLISYACNTIPFYAKYICKKLRQGKQNNCRIKSQFVECF